MKYLIIGIVVIISGSIFYYTYYNKKHPCIQKQTYCYYETHGVATGVGPTIGGNGGMAVTVSPTTAKIYIDCKNVSLTPEEVYTEDKCVLRE